MNAKKLFDDDDVIFPELGAEERPSHVDVKEAEAPITRRDSPGATANYLRRVPVLLVATAELPLLPLDHREGFLVAHIDGTSTLETLLDVCAMPATEALKVIETLISCGVVTLR
jgi:hypothetical protein